MKIYKTKENGNVVEDILCNKCGESLKVFISSDHNIFNYIGLEEHGHIGHYGSKYFDMEKWQFSLCDECLAELICSFKHPPDIWTGYLHGRCGTKLTDEKAKEMFEWLLNDVDKRKKDE